LSQIAAKTGHRLRRVETSATKAHASGQHVRVDASQWFEQHIGHLLGQGGDVLVVGGDDVGVEQRHDLGAELAVTQSFRASLR
jgi:hypothetical protein